MPGCKSTFTVVRWDGQGSMRASLTWDLWNVSGFIFVILWYKHQVVFLPFLSGKPLMIITEYMENGSLDAFLRVRGITSITFIREKMEFMLSASPESTMSSILLQQNCQIISQNILKHVQFNLCT